MLSAIQSFSKKMLNEDILNNPEKFISESQETMLNFIESNNLIKKEINSLENINTIKENTINNLMKNFNLDNKENIMNDLKIKFEMMKSLNNTFLIDEKLD